MTGGLWGAIIGDALGVPVEFASRSSLKTDPVTSMREYGTHCQPRGTWSDDGSLILCTLESLVNSEFDLNDMGNRFVRWMDEGIWTANGNVFDIGTATSMALSRIALGTPAEQGGGRDENSNGNGSLMRVLPVALRFASEPIDSFARRLESASAITHGHERSRMACVFYGLIVRHLLSGLQSCSALDAARVEFSKKYADSPELPHFRRIIKDDLGALSEDEIDSTGYVLHTLHASLWCLMNTNHFEECVLKAVNLGGDTDTTGCVAGGLAGVAYGANSIPSNWIQQLARMSDLERLISEFASLT